MKCPLSRRKPIGSTNQRLTSGLLNKPLAPKLAIHWKHKCSAKRALIGVEPLLALDIQPQVCHTIQTLRRSLWSVVV